MTTTEQHLKTVQRRLEGRNQYGHVIHGAECVEEALPHALLALVTEQQATNAHLERIAASIERIADALTKPATPAPEPEPKRRLWLPGRRTA